MRADTHAGPERYVPHTRPNTLCSTSRSSSWESVLRRATGPYILAQAASSRRCFKLRQLRGVPLT
jgi:hypothetical protein